MVNEEGVCAQWWRSEIDDTIMYSRIECVSYDT